MITVQVTTKKDTERNPQDPNILLINTRKEEKK
jgi:hypothetical protein